MYTTRWCGYCVRAKTLLEARGLAVRGDLLDDDPAFRQRLLELTGGWTVPQILIDGRPIGGYTELVAARPQRRAGQAGRLSYIRWHVGQYHVPRPAARIFSIGVPQRSHGSPSRP